MAETFCARFGSRWGTKSTTEHHPPSKDAIAYHYEDGTIAVWDWQNGTTREPQVEDGRPPNYDRLRQFFIAVNVDDHLAPTPPPDPKPAPDPVGLHAQLHRIEAKLDRLLTAVYVFDPATNTLRLR